MVSVKAVAGSYAWNDRQDLGGLAVCEQWSQHWQACCIILCQACQILPLWSVVFSVRTSVSYVFVQWPYHSQDDHSAFSWNRSRDNCCLSAGHIIFTGVFCKLFAASWHWVPICGRVMHIGMWDIDLICRVFDFVVGYDETVIAVIMHIEQGNRRSHFARAVHSHHPLPDQSHLQWTWQLRMIPSTAWRYWRLNWSLLQQMRYNALSLCQWRRKPQNCLFPWGFRHLPGRWPSHGHT